jgi:hypothetical protein
MVQTAAVRVRTPLGYCAVAAAGVALGAATVGASSWSIASVLSGALVQFKRLPHEGQDTTHSGTE